MKLTVSDIAKMIDHSLLRPNLTEAEFLEGVELSKDFQVATCSVVPFDVARAVKLLGWKWSTGEHCGCVSAWHCTDRSQSV